MASLADPSPQLDSFCSRNTYVCTYIYIYTYSKVRSCARRRHPIDAYRSVTILVLRGRRAKQAPDSSTLGVDVASKCRAPAPLVYRRFSCRHRNVCTFFCPDTHVSKYLSGDTPFGRRCRWLHWVLCRNMLNRSANEFSSTRPSHKNKIAMKAKIHTATMMWNANANANEPSMSQCESRKNLHCGTTG